MKYDTYYLLKDHLYYRKICLLFERGNLCEVGKQVRFISLSLSFGLTHRRYKSSFPRQVSSCVTSYAKDGFLPKVLTAIPQIHNFQN